MRKTERRSRNRDCSARITIRAEYRCLDGSLIMMHSVEQPTKQKPNAVIRGSLRKGQ